MNKVNLSIVSSISRRPRLDCPRQGGHHRIYSLNPSSAAYSGKMIDPTPELGTALTEVECTDWLPKIQKENLYDGG